MKQTIREEVRKIRDALNEKERDERAKLIMDRIFELMEFKTASTIFFYVSFRSEVNTIPSIERTLAMDKKVVLPVVKKKKNGWHSMKLIPFRN